MSKKSKQGIRKETTTSKHAPPQKATNTTESNLETTSGLSQEVEDQFELELCWCVQQLELCLATGKLSQKQVQDLQKSINALKSNNAPLIKKRQIMRNTLGNYREKMALDEQKLGKSTATIKFTGSSAQDQKCTFLRKAVCTTLKEKEQSDDTVATTKLKDNSVDIDNVQNAFKFNFQIKE